MKLVVGVNSKNLPLLIIAELLAYELEMLEIDIYLPRSALKHVREIVKFWPVRVNYLFDKEIRKQVYNKIIVDYGSFFEL